MNSIIYVLSGIIALILLMGGTSGLILMISNNMIFTLPSAIATITILLALKWLTYLSE